MKYTKESILAQYQAGKEIKILTFWGHTPSSEAITKSCLSQWYACEFELYECEYHSAEQYMMAKKAELFQDYAAYHKIMAADNPKDCKALGREVRNFNSDLWNREKYRIVLTGNLAKFSRNPELYQFLDSTGDCVLVEASPYDDIWGVNLSADDPRIQDPSQWQGENLLGFALMEVRDILREWKAFQWDDVEWNEFEDEDNKDGDDPEITYYASTGFVFKDGQVGLLRNDGSGIGRKELLVFYPQWDDCEEMGTGYTLAADPYQDYRNDCGDSRVFQNAYYFVRTKQGDKYGVVDTAGRVVTPCKWDEIDSRGNARQGNLWGFVNLLTCEETPPQWTENQYRNPYKWAFSTAVTTNWGAMFCGGKRLNWSETMTLFYAASKE